MDSRISFGAGKNRAWQGQCQCPSSSESALRPSRLGFWPSRKGYWQGNAAVGMGLARRARDQCRQGQGQGNRQLGYGKKGAESWKTEDHNRNWDDKVRTRSYQGRTRQREMAMQRSKGPVYSRAQSWAMTATLLMPRKNEARVGRGETKANAEQAGQ